MEIHPANQKIWVGIIKKIKKQKESLKERKNYKKLRENEKERKSRKCSECRYPKHPGPCPCKLCGKKGHEFRDCPKLKPPGEVSEQNNGILH